MATIGTTAGHSGLGHSEVERYLRRRRVLLADDDASIGLICSLNLRAAAFEVTEAADGLQGFDAGFVTKPFDPVALVALLSGVIDRTAAA